MKRCRTYKKDFSTKKTELYWQWEFRNSIPIIKQRNGALHLSGNTKPENVTGVVLTARPVSGSFEMTTTVLNTNAALKGLAYYGDAGAAVGIGIENDQVIAW